MLPPDLAAAAEGDAPVLGEDVEDGVGPGADARRDGVPQGGHQLDVGGPQPVHGGGRGGRGGAQGAGEPLEGLHPALAPLLVLGGTWQSFYGPRQYHRI